jgi:hypothetical protein
MRRLAPRKAVIEVQISCRRNFSASGGEGMAVSGTGLAAPLAGFAVCDADSTLDGFAPPATPTPGFDFASMDVR